PETEAPDDGYQDGWGEEEGPIYNGGGYILPNSSSELLTRDSLVGLNAGDLLLARNEIFARHGRMFDDEWLQSYFDSQPWYQPIYSPSEFSYDLLSSIEIENINTILAYEAELGA
ncbi:MAG: YARHG domain-containing protein, partial [Eubacteriales bacterium]|nr:YARHG domain-containing protein [Eubacteriales bacterium]